MNSKLFYKVMSGFYDLLDVIYFRKYETPEGRLDYQGYRIFETHKS